MKRIDECKKNEYHKVHRCYDCCYYGDDCDGMKSNMKFEFIIDDSAKQRKDPFKIDISDDYNLDSIITKAQISK